MINFRKVLVMATVLVAAYPCANALAQGQNQAPAPVAAPASAYVQAPVHTTKPAILLKINNVKTIKNDEGVAIACDFDAVVYNRTDDLISGATVDLSWQDETAQDFVKDEDKREKAREAVETRSATTKSASRSARTANRRAKNQVEMEADAANLTFTLDIPEVQPYNQLTITSRLKSDKCFLLVHDAVVASKTCNATSSRQDAPAQGRNPASARNSGCGDLFEFISSKDSQYYRDFKKIDPEAERLARLSKQELIKQEVEADYQRAMQAMDAIATELDTIQ